MIFDDGRGDSESLIRELLRNVSDEPAGLWTQVLNKISDPLTPLLNPALVPDGLFAWGDDDVDVLDGGPDDDHHVLPDDDYAVDDDDFPVDDDDFPVDDDDPDFDDF